MSPRISSHSIRLRGMDQNTSMEDLHRITRQLIDRFTKHVPRLPFNRSTGTGAAEHETLQCSLAEQHERLTATITFPSDNIKRRLMKEKDKIHKEGFEIDDLFDGLTVLHNADGASVDICAVHGFGGHAFDSWASSSKMWLRDLLPSSSPFDKSRIMTFSYDAALLDETSDSYLAVWANELLREVCSVRSMGERSRPILFVCHSMGGLVVREAMVRLKHFPSEFCGLTLQQCGLLFLATPHYGTTQADWNALILGACDVIFGTPSKIIKQLQPFHSSSAACVEAFSNMERVPPFYCMCEGRKTTVLAGPARTIVTRVSAGFLNKAAEVMPDRDHRTICQFENKFSGYQRVLDILQKLREETTLSNNGIRLDSLLPKANIPGYPDDAAPHFPPASQKWYEGAGLSRSSRVIGRSEILNDIAKAVESDVPPRIYALTGTGGIGKTAILLELALHFRHQVNLFYLRATKGVTLEHEVLSLANSIGDDILGQQSTQIDKHAVWRQLGPKERISKFKKWLGEHKNQPSVFVVDDLDAVKNDEDIKSALPFDVQTLMYSSRDPSILTTLRDMTYSEAIGSENFIIPEMNVEETVLLMSAAIQTAPRGSFELNITERELEEIARTVGGHPLGASRAIAYISQVLSLSSPGSPTGTFLDIFRGSKWKARQRFLTWKPRLATSIMESFDMSLERLEHGENVTPMMELVACLSESKDILDFRSFLRLERPWLNALKPWLPDFQIFACELDEQSQYLAALENVSIGLRSNSGPMRLHPLWRECILQRAGPEGRLRWLSQIHILCRNSIDRNEAIDIIPAFEQNCRDIAQKFQIVLSEDPSATSMHQATE